MGVQEERCAATLETLESFKRSVTLYLFEHCFEHFSLEKKRLKMFIL